MTTVSGLSGILALLAPRATELGKSLKQAQLSVKVEAA